MNRKASNMYARFNDIFEEPDELPTAVFSSEGKIEFVNIDEELKSDSKPDLPPDRTKQEKKHSILRSTTKSIRLSRKALIFSIFALVIFVIFIFILASFIVMLQNRGEIQSLKDQNTTKLINHRVSALLSMRLGRIKSNIRDQYQISSNILDEKIELALTNLSEKAIARIKGLCKIDYEDKCYWAEKKNTRFDTGAELCHAHGAEAANIYNKEHFQIIVKYLRDFMAPRKTVWLGMTRNSTAEVTRLRNGTISNYTMLWYPGYPLNRTSWSQIGLHFEKDEDASHQGFFNDRPYATRHGILCEI